MVEFLNLPLIALEKIFSYMSYDEISRCRLICKRIDVVCKKLLTKGFLNVEKYHSQCLKTVKAQLPRRESERRNHALSRHCDILTAIETRLSMLAMTFMKYVDIGLCCFIPGKVIDEIYRVLWSVQKSKSLPRAHEMLLELRDISSMAMEHFDEKIVPGLKHTLGLNSQRGSKAGNCNYNFTGGHMDFLTTTASHRILAQGKLRMDTQRMLLSSRKNQAVVVNLKNSIIYLKSKMKKQNIQISKQITKLREQEAKLSDHTAQLADLRKHIEEYDQKFADLSAELSRARGIDVATTVELPSLSNKSLLIKLDTDTIPSQGQAISGKILDCPANVVCSGVVKSEKPNIKDEVDVEDTSIKDKLAKRKVTDDYCSQSEKRIKL